MEREINCLEKNPVKVMSIHRKCEKPRTLMVGHFLRHKFKPMSQYSKKVVYISGVSGQYVTKPYANSHPKTTVKMVVKKG